MLVLVAERGKTTKKGGWNGDDAEIARSNSPGAGVLPPVITA